MLPCRLRTRVFNRALYGCTAAAPAPQTNQLQVVATAEAVVVFLDQQYRPIRIPADVRDAFLALHKQREAAAPAPPHQ